MKRILGLDGLRGLAIAMVIGVHLFGFKPGWLGVDIFFVLSGFLITTILLSEREDEHFWKIFYIRRASRILPPFLLFLVVAALTVSLPRPTLWLYLIFSAANIAAWHYPVLYDLGVMVLWSLSVEEHFYLVWPALVRRLHVRTLVKLLCAVIVLEPALRLIALHISNDWRLVYNLTPFRLDGLAMGALLAIAFRDAGSKDRLRIWVPRLLPIGLAAVACSYPLLDVNFHARFRNGIMHSLMSVVSSLLIAHLILFSGSGVSKLLSLQPLVFLGRISYGLYLFHLLIVMKFWEWRHGHSVKTALAALSVSILISWLSFRFLETPVIRWGRLKVGSYREERAVLAQAQGS